MRKTIITFLALILLVFTLGTSTYAWITIARTSQIESITLIATLGDSLEISLDGETYYETLPKEEILKKTRYIRLTDVTSIDGKTFTHLDENKVIEKNIEYISLDFYFRTKSKREHYVYLANNISHDIDYYNTEEKEGTFIVSRGVNYRIGFDYLYDENVILPKNELKTYYLSEAMRISTISNLEGQEVVKIFDLSGNEHRGYGKPYGGYDYYKKVTGKNLELPTIIPPTIYELSKFDPNGPFSLDDNSKLLKLDVMKDFNGETYYTGKITLNIWAEGWDADLFDPVISDRIKIQLQFKAVRN